ncbi:MAG: hypothetical protein AB7Q29_11945 [Vicinamibacterales bacterium]
MKKRGQRFIARRRAHLLHERTSHSLVMRMEWLSTVLDETNECDARAADDDSPDAAVDAPAMILALSIGCALGWIYSAQVRLLLEVVWLIATSRR